MKKIQSVDVPDISTFGYFDMLIADGARTAGRQLSGKWKVVVESNLRIIGVCDWKRILEKPKLADGCSGGLSK